MDSFTFILAFTAISSLLFAYYYLLLRREKRFQFNRFFLLALLPLSAILPFVKLDVFQTKEISPVLSSSLETITITSEAVSSWAYGYAELLGILYLYISLILLGALILRLSKLMLFIKRSTHKEKISGATVIYAASKISPASFGPYIFWTDENTLSEGEKNQIIAHELCHIRQFHSLDILFLELWKVLFWFHPLIYLISRELKMIHEYQADQAALQQGKQQSYIQLLLSQTLGQPLKLTHNFFQLPLKNRIMMLNKKTNSRFSAIKYGMLLPFFVTLFIACNSQYENEPTDLPVSTGETTKIIVTESEGESGKLYHISELENDFEVDEEPVPMNLQEIKREIGYPKIAQDAGIDGQVILRILVGKDGKYIQHKVISQVHPILARAVEEHIKTLTFKPAEKEGQPVQFWVNIPFNFVLVD